MSEKEFNIESRLGAYIDGLLDAEQREQIEQYLDRYPEHRQLIDQLMQERALLCDLPHEAAPPDVLGHFQGQLERSALLGDLAADIASGRSTRRRWNLAAFLAALLLLGGLGVIVWIAMPPRRIVRTANVGELPALPIEPAAASQPATTTAASEPTSQPALPTPRRPETLASVINAGGQTFVIIFSSDLAAAQKRTEQFLKSHGLSATPPSSSTRPITTRPATTQSNMISPPPITSWLVTGMTPLEARELAASFSTQQPTSTAPAPATRTIASSRPAMQAQPASQPTLPVIIRFQMLDLPPNSAVNPDR